MLLLFTGLRRQEAATLKWENIDLKDKTLTIEDTKNNQPHTLPLSDYLYDLLKQRKLNATNDYVFPGTGTNGYIVEPRKQLANVTKTTGIQFMIHDLRRTFVTIAESLDISAYAVKRLVNHKMKDLSISCFTLQELSKRWNKSEIEIIQDWTQDLYCVLVGQKIHVEGKEKKAIT